ncbi:single-stranded DNA-binding protein [Pseudoclavibacter sp. 13-3]|uniref:single-stranded DNA-binding protein n=1 Tax=Pseudoclavibacter sp. 13-3 TaxID=2901228 RepID=UPI001E49FAA2|nr:single-stranded DNA-binding protein [Pseudoclavibacter sp. 13-3]MCD7100830.1 single-stranded DNA-binding protein [Pseudoclavibacter sp. 13-3]
MSIDTIAVNGLVATEPQTNFTRDGKPITSFRLASNQRRFDQKEGRWVDGDTNWFTVTAFRQLATHAQQSLFKGHHVLVQGRLRVKQWQNEERSGTTVEIVADNMGHDLAWGISALTKPERQPPASLRREDASGEAAAAEDVAESTAGAPADSAPRGGLEDQGGNWGDASAQPEGWNEPGMQSEPAAATLGG